MTHEISSTTSCTSHESDHAQCGRKFQNNCVQNPKNGPADRQIRTRVEMKLSKIIIIQKNNVSHSLSSQADPRSTLSNTFEHLPLLPRMTPPEMKLPKTIIAVRRKYRILAKRSSILDRLLQTLSNISHFSALHNSSNVFLQTPSNVPLVRGKKETFHATPHPTRSSSRTPSVSRERRRRNLAGLPGYQVDSEAESPGRVHLRGCKAEGSVGRSGIDVPRRRSASSREHERVLTAAGLDGLAVRRESEGTCWSLGRRWRDDQPSRKLGGCRTTRPSEICLTDIEVRELSVI